MPNRKTTNIISFVAIAGAIIAIVYSTFYLPPRIDRKLHSEIGAVLAREALGLLGPKGKITVISRDTEAFPQPTLDLLQKSFNREINRAGRSIAAIEKLQVDPIRPVTVPSGDFYELLRKAPSGNVIVSFLGPPFLTDDQQSKLGRPKAHVVAFCSAHAAGDLALKGLFEAGVLHVALVNRESGATKNQQIGFDRLYTLIKGGPGQPK